MKNAVIVSTLVAAAALVLGGSQSSAHHAVAAQFDVSQGIKKEGKLVRVDWINPHAWFHFQTENEETGEPEIWSLETTGPNGLRRLGLSDRRLFPIGETYTFEGYPDWTGDTKAFATAFTLPDGRRVVIGFVDESGVGQAGAAPGAAGQIGRAPVCTPVTNAPLVCRLLLDK